MKYLLFLLMFFPLFAETPLDLATKKYLEAEKDPVHKEALLNEALTTYLSLEDPDSSGDFMMNVGNIYLSLNNFGMAITYYLKAERLLPRDPEIQKNLRIAISKAETGDLQISRPLYDLLGMKSLSPTERNLLLIGTIAISFVFFSLHTFLPKYGFFFIFFTMFSMTIALLGATLLYTTVVPPRAVVVKATPLYKEPSSGILVTLKPGETVEVLSMKAPWMEIRTARNTKGYVPIESGRVVE